MKLVSQLISLRVNLIFSKSNTSSKYNNVLYQMSFPKNIYKILEGPNKLLSQYITQNLWRLILFNFNSLHGSY